MTEDLRRRAVKYRLKGRISTKSIIWADKIAHAVESQKKSSDLQKANPMHRCQRDTHSSPHKGMQAGEWPEPRNH